MKWSSPLLNLSRSMKSSSSHFNRSLCNSTPTLNSSSTRFLYSYRFAVALSFPILAIGTPFFFNEELKCASEARSYAKPQLTETLIESESEGKKELESDYSEESILSVRDLSFGTVAGICTGIFLKKGLKVCFVRVLIWLMLLVNTLFLLDCCFCFWWHFCSLTGMLSFSLLTLSLTVVANLPSLSTLLLDLSSISTGLILQTLTKTSSQKLLDLTRGVGGTGL